MHPLDPRLWLLRVVLLLVLLIVVLKNAFADHYLGLVLRTPEARLELTFEDCRDPLILRHVPVMARASTHKARGAPGPACWYPDPEVAEIYLVTRKGAIAVPTTYLAREQKA